MRSHSQSIGWCLGLLVTVIASGLSVRPKPLHGTSSGGEQANCDQQGKLVSAEQEYGVVSLNSAKEFAELQRAKLG